MKIMDCEGKCILIKGENDDEEINFSFEIVKVYSRKGSTVIPGQLFCRL
jgi:hypothetical protein